MNTPMQTIVLASALSLFTTTLLAQTEPTEVRVGRITKKAIGTVTAMEAGDVACYLTLRDDKGGVFEELADLDVCEQRSLIGKRVALHYEMNKVISDECQGDPECTKTRTVPLVMSLRLLKPAVEDPVAVVRELYRTHARDEAAILTPQSKDALLRYFDTRLATLIWQDVTTTPEGEVGRLDFDPFYNAQDFEIKNLKFGTPKVTGDTARVTVSFDNYAQSERLEYHLRRQSGRWRISNIVYGKDSDLVSILTESP